jgi:hypothetical protein
LGLVPQFYQKKKIKKNNPANKQRVLLMVKSSGGRVYSESDSSMETECSCFFRGKIKEQLRSVVIVLCGPCYQFSYIIKEFTSTSIPKIIYMNIHKRETLS